MRISDALRNADMLPKLPDEINKKALIDWGELLVERSEIFADRNRLGAVYFRPILTFLTGVTGAAGVARRSMAGMGCWS